MQIDVNNMAINDVIYLATVSNPLTGPGETKAGAIRGIYRTLLMTMKNETRQIGWPMVSFGPVNLWTVVAAWRLARTTPAVAPKKDTLAQGIHPKVRQLLTQR